MKVTVYHKPDGRQEILDIPNINADDAKWFEANNAVISMEDIGDMFAVYADIGLVYEGELDEIMELSMGRTCVETLAALRIECMNALAEVVK
jgi:hypothetical protein